MRLRARMARLLRRPGLTVRLPLAKTRPPRTSRAVTRRLVAPARKRTLQTLARARAARRRHGWHRRDPGLRRLDRRLPVAPVRAGDEVALGQLGIAVGAVAAAVDHARHDVDAPAQVVGGEV